MKRMNREPIKMLVVDDDPRLLAVLEASLKMDDEYDVTVTTSAQEAAQWATERTYDIVVADYKLNGPEITGIEILRRARQRSIDTLVIIITAYATLEISLEAIHLGAYDFLTKPFQVPELTLVVRNAANLIRLNRENIQLREQVVSLIEALDEIERSHADLVERMEQIDRELGALGAADPLPGSVMDAEAIQDMRRRSVRERIDAYKRMGESIRKRMAQQRQQIETLVQLGLTRQHEERPTGNLER
jgi:CheY-like chemotaxis protein